MTQAAEILEITAPTRWVKLARYCHLTGDTRDAVHSRRRKGVWVDGIHCKVAGGALWVNMQQIEKWIESPSLSARP